MASWRPCSALGAPTSVARVPLRMSPPTPRATGPVPACFLHFRSRHDVKDERCHIRGSEWRMAL